ncbi:MAG: hypothetical protein QF560_13150 [SAR324 cluster bacterium]|jgi:hypothetical protein|nr:hypothetical protein [Deltaproteobacteria bacterium]MAE00094.1 hypothetical protein [Pseudomonadota bacterium]MDP6091360.1 hypothetical protein [SAR324 cluster bacterium]MBI13402.1 hypothetical protein [Deltaproteobacteria bacterium]MDP6245644.1 hypothetical protein [SAR324 cluster bacterium]
MDDSIRRAKLKRLQQIHEQKRLHLKERFQKRMEQDPENVTCRESHSLHMPLKSRTWLHSRRHPFKFLEPKVG